MNLNSSVETIYGELVKKQDCLEWLHERTGQNWYVVTTEEGFGFEIIHCLDTDRDYQNGFSLFKVSLFQEVDDEQIKTAVHSFVHKLSEAIDELYREKCG